MSSLANNIIFFPCKQTPYFLSLQTTQTIQIFFPFQTNTIFSSLANKTHLTIFSSHANKSHNFFPYKQSFLPMQTTQPQPKPVVEASKQQWDGTNDAPANH